jgi:hypothetical protein
MDVGSFYKGLRSIAHNVKAYKTFCCNEMKIKCAVGQGAKRRSLYALLGADFILSSVLVYSIHWRI